MTRRFTREEVARRSRREDAALIIDNVVYDVSRFLDDHPGGAEILLDNAGQDASRCFRDVGHSEDAKLWRAEFRIGEVVAEQRRPELSAPVAAPEPERELSLRGALHACAPPLLLAVLAAALYGYLFT